MTQKTEKFIPENIKYSQRCIGNEFINLIFFCFAKILKRRTKSFVCFFGFYLQLFEQINKEH